MEQDEYDALVNYLKTRSYKANISENEKRRIRSRSKKFLIKEVEGLDCLYTDNNQVVVASGKKKNAMDICHITNGCHLGRDKTFQKIKSKYYWKGMFADVSDYVKKCQECQLTNKKTETYVPPMNSVKIEPRIFGKVGIDLIGPFLKKNGKPLSEAGYRYVLTIMDYFSKWPEAFPIYSKCTEEVVDKLHQLICRYGVISNIVSDQGGEFNSKLIELFTSKFEIRHITTSPYHPQANGMIEKFNSTLKSMLNKCIKDHGSKWHEYIDITLFAYRTSQHESTKVTPFYALYLREPILINQEEISPIENSSEVNELAIQKTIDKLQEARASVEKKMSENINVAQSKQKAAYDRRHNVDCKVYQTGDKVLLKNFRRKKGICEQTRYLGPYLIHEYCGKGCYKLKSKDDKVIGPYNQKSLKKYYDADEDDEGEMDENNNDIDGEATETAESELEQSDSDNYIFITQNKFQSTPKDLGTFVDPVINDSISDYFDLNTQNPASFDIEIEEMIEHSRPKRQRKLKQSSIYEYYSK